VPIIHQPSQHIFQLFDDILFINEGKLMYYGEVSKVRRCMTDLGYGCDTETGTAEHVLDCVSRLVGSDFEAERLSDERIEYIACAASNLAQKWVSFNGDGEESEDDAGKESSENMKQIIDNATGHPGTNIFRQFTLLLGRSVQELLHGKTAIFIKIMTQVVMGVIYGGIYTFGDDQVRLWPSL